MTIDNVSLTIENDKERPDWSGRSCFYSGIEIVWRLEQLNSKHQIQNIGIMYPVSTSLTPLTGQTIKHDENINVCFNLPM